MVKIERIVVQPMESPVTPSWGEWAWGCAKKVGMSAALGAVAAVGNLAARYIKTVDARIPASVGLGVGSLATATGGVAAALVSCVLGGKNREVHHLVLGTGMGLTVAVGGAVPLAATHMLVAALTIRAHFSQDDNDPADTLFAGFFGGALGTICAAGTASVTALETFLPALATGAIVITGALVGTNTCPLTQQI